MKHDKQVVVDMGLRLRKMRVEAQMTQQELAVRAGIGLNRLGGMERGKGTTSLESWIKVSLILEAEKGWQEVFGVEENPFDEYDRRMAEKNNLLKTRVRKKRN